MGTKGLRSRLAQEIYTCCAFWIAMSTLPALALSYIVVRLSKHLWLKLLSSRYPDLEFIRTDTVRSVLDTHRNQGIINVLLSVKGVPDMDQIKHQLTHHVTERKNKNGDLKFPRLRQLLVSCWGNYAWDKNIAFRLENHLVLANGVHRGRPVTDNNIQDYVSDIVSKYFPSDQPPWQYVIIPCANTIPNEPKYYVLVRAHHLLLAGPKSINIGDLLLVEQLRQTDSISTPMEYTEESPLTKLFPTPSAIPELWDKLNENLSNAWNEFVSEYDPVESPRALKTLPGAFHVAGLILISGVSAIRELTKRRSFDRDYTYEASVTATTLLAAIQRECKRRNLSVGKILVSPLVTADPRKWPRLTFTAAKTTTSVVVKFPSRLREEFNALRQLKNVGRVPYPGTLTWKYGELAQLCVRATMEAWQGLIEAYKAPGVLWADVLRSNDGKRHLLQTISLCGRKVTAWSRPVPREGVERAARALGVSSTDIALFAATEALRAFFEHTDCATPEQILTTARAAPEEYLLNFTEGCERKMQTGGMVCLSLPVGATPRRIASVVEDACNRQGSLAKAWVAQDRYGTFIKAVPSPFARVTLNLLTRRYAVAYTEINAPLNSNTRNTVWGQTVDSVLYWRPSQANISMSLTVIQYANTIRLAVMADARLTPGQNVPANRWPTAIEQLITKVDQEIARIAARTQTTIRSIPIIVTPEEDISDEIQHGLEDQESTSSLRPPSTTVVSPPPMRRRISHN